MSIENFGETNNVPVPPEKIPEEVFVPKKKPEEEPQWVGKEEKERKADEETARKYQDCIDKANESIEFFMAGRGDY